MKFFGEIFEGSVASLNAMGALWMIVMMLLVTADVIGRSLFNYKFTGVPELIRASVVAVTFLEISYVLLKDKHIRTNVIQMRLSPRGQEILFMVAFLTGITLFVLLCLSSWGPMWKGWVIHEYEGEGSLRVPVYPVRSIIFLSSALMAIQFARMTFGSFKRLLGLGSAKALVAPAEKEG